MISDGDAWMRGWAPKLSYFGWGIGDPYMPLKKGVKAGCLNLEQSTGTPCLLLEPTTAPKLWSKKSPLFLFHIDTIILSARVKAGWFDPVRSKFHQLC